MITRRAGLALLAGLASTPAAMSSARAAASTFRVGYQKGEPLLVAAKQNGSIEARLHPLGISVQWIEFQFGPPILEAMRVGGVDFGGVGDAPPIFAQAAHADLVYTAAVRSGASAILLPPGSKLQTLHDLKGRKVAFSRGSSAHNLTVAALEKAGLTFADIQPVYLAPADASAAFMTGAVDAWTIWDPYVAIFEQRPGVRVLAFAKDITPQNSYYLASRAFADRNPQILAQAVEALRGTAQWALSHRDTVAQMLAAGTGVPLVAEQRAVARTPFVLLPMTDEFVRDQQAIADRFQALGILPHAIAIRDQVWRASS